MEGEMEYVWIIGYLTCCVLAWFIFADDHRKLCNLTFSDGVTILILSSLGPASVFCAVIVWLAGCQVDYSYKKSKILWRKK